MSKIYMLLLLFLATGSLLHGRPVDRGGASGDESGGSQVLARNSENRTAAENSASAFNAITVSGTVTDDGGLSMPGVNVIEKGTTNGTVTDTDGKFSLSVADGTSTLVFSFIGYVSQEVQVNNQNNFSIALVSDISTLSEVVVVGYGEQKRESLTGAISNISAKDIQTSTHSSLAQKLQGKVAGLQIRQNGGQPGEFNTMISVRGFGTPLFVIDGIARDGTSEFQRLNPEDIESISVLKDASAAIYGIRAANGVIIVTTKKGQAGKTVFNYNGVVGWQTPTNVPRMANASEWARMRNDAEVNKNHGNGTPFYSREELQKYVDGVPGYEGTDWYDVTMKNSSMQSQHNLSASGGVEKMKYFISLGHVSEEGLLRSNDMGYKKYTVRSNLTAELTKSLKAELFLSGRYDKNEQPGENFFNIFKGTRVTLPTESPYANGNPLYPGTVGSGQNPLALSNRDLTGYSENVDKQFQSSLALTYTVPFVTGLSVRGLASYDGNSYLNKSLAKSYKLYTYSNATQTYDPTIQRNGTADISNRFSDYNRITLQAQLNYARTFREKHNVAALLVYEQQEQYIRNSFLRRVYSFYTTDQIDFAGQQQQFAQGIEEQRANLSYIGRFNYDYANKYLLEFAFREDGSYRYNPDQRWDFFPVISLGWRISEENFMKNTLPMISELKLRGSYGIVGADAGDPFQWAAGFSLSGGAGYEFTNGAFTSGAASPAIVNPNLSWTTAKTSDIGINLGLWDNRVTLEFDVYQRDTEGYPAVRNVTLPNTFGGQLPQENINSARVRGFDFTLGYRGSVNDFRFGISANFNYARTKNLYVEERPYTNSYDRWRNQQSNRWNDILWSYTYDGQFQNQDEINNAPLQNGNLGNSRELPGDFRYSDINNDGVIDGNDMLPLYLGSGEVMRNVNFGDSKSNPKMQFGMTLNGQWKNFDINLLFQGSAGYTVRFYEVYAEVFAFRGNTPAYFADAWHKADPYDADSEWVAGKWPATRFNNDVGAMYNESSVWRKDASYVRLKSVELGYTFHAGLLERAGITRLRFYGNAYNVFTIANSFVKPFDPEKLEGLYSAGFTYPLTKSYNFGINLTF
jgi:TonB-linked SusC/RagA family outer membrane protein